MLVKKGSPQVPIKYEWVVYLFFVYTIIQVVSVWGGVPNFSNLNPLRNFFTFFWSFCTHANEKIFNFNLFGNIFTFFIYTCEFFHCLDNSNKKD